MLLFPYYLYAGNILEMIEIKAAELSSCSITQPCEITIDKKNSAYIVKVKQSALVTEYGVIKYKTGSTTYYKFDDQGQCYEVMRTT